MNDSEDIKKKIAAMSKGNSVAVFGAGVSGMAAKKLLDKLGIESDIYADGCAAGTNANFKPFDKFRPEKHSLIVYSPAFRPDNQHIASGEAAGATAICETDLSAIAWRGKIIAVTGTNGKTTTTSFISHALSLNGTRSVAAGNIGKPLCAFCAGNSDTSGITAVCELSSFQTSRIKFLQPDALVWTNFAPDHLDWHKNMEEYFFAKFNTVKNLRGEIMCAGDSVLKAAEMFSATLPDFAKIFGEKNLPPCPAPFNSPVQAQNYVLSCEILKSFGLSENAVEQAAKTFKLPAYRFSTPMTVGSIKFYNDSKATNAHAAIAALESLSGVKKLIWLGGGKDKFCDLQELTCAVKKYASGAVLIGQTAAKLKTLLSDIELGAHICESMDEAVKLCAELGGENSSVLFSPGFSSFGMFNGYAERGKSFENAVLCLKNLNK